MSDIWWSLPLSVGAFMLARRLAAKLKISLINPLLVSMAIIIPLLLVLQIPYARYFAGSQILNQLLQPAVVALALPLYEQMHQIRARWKSLIGVCFIGSLTAMVSGTAPALWRGATPEIAATLLGVKTRAARGLAIGNASHALGTARAAEVDYQEGAFSSLALVLCGIITSLLAPFIFPLLLHALG